MAASRSCRWTSNADISSGCTGEASGLERCIRDVSVRGAPAGVGLSVQCRIVRTSPQLDRHFPTWTGTDRHTPISRISRFGSTRPGVRISPPRQELREFALVRLVGSGRRLRIAGSQRRSAQNMEERQAVGSGRHRYVEDRVDHSTVSRSRSFSSRNAPIEPDKRIRSSLMRSPLASDTSIESM